MMVVFTATALLSWAAISLADTANRIYTQWSVRGSDEDLFKYVTRPDLTPPKLNVAVHRKDRTAEGYIFLAPYDCLECSEVPITTYVTQQMGPLIYTDDGELVWSGADLYPGTKVFDFRPVMINGEHHLSLIAPTDMKWQPFPDGFATVLNASYQPIFSVGTKELGMRIDMHEWHILGDGETALVGMIKHRQPLESDNIQWKDRVMDCSFTEIDLRTQKRLFNWTASHHVPFTETSNPPPGPEVVDKFWDWFHLNSMDKDKFGNYLISARATNTIYYIGPDGNIIWRLGGPNSSFTQDFNFSRQHHARVARQNEVNMVISFFDNAADDSGKWTPTAETSGLMIVGLDLVKMTATQFHRHNRPDGGLTETKGNVHWLPNGGIFGGWGENAYMTEYVNPGGEKLYEASFASKRFANYRAYKMDFVGQPTTKPVIKGFVSVNSRGQLRTSIYVSWNGATEVKTWRFYSHLTTHGGKRAIHIGDTPKAGFETNFMATGFHPITYVEGLDVFGNSLGNSSLEVTEIPTGFHNAESPMYFSSEPRLPGSWAMRTAVAFIAGLIVASLWERLRVGKLGTIWERLQVGQHNVAWRAGSLRWARARKRN